VSIRFLPSAPNEVNQVWRDLRHGARLPLGAPGFTAVGVCALALGI
jgi:hypothetical protein